MYVCTFIGHSHLYVRVPSVQQAEAMKVSMLVVSRGATQIFHGGAGGRELRRGASSPVLRTECGDASFQSAPDGDREDAWHRRRRHRRRETAERTAGEATFDRTPVTRMTFVV